MYGFCRDSYAHLLGLYLRDGCLPLPRKGVPFVADRVRRPTPPGLIEEAERAIVAVDLDRPLTCRVDVWHVKPSACQLRVEPTTRVAPGCWKEWDVFVGSHVIVYSEDAEADRAFISDVLGFPSVDAGAGWLIFRLPPAEIAVHPADGGERHEFYLMCDDLEGLLDRLAEAGVDVSRDITEARWGRLAGIRLPSGAELPVYQPLHPVAYDLPD